MTDKSLTPSSSSTVALNGFHQWIIEDAHLMLGVLMYIAGGEDRELREELRQLLGRGDRHLQIAGSDGFEFGILRDQARIIMRLVGREVGNRWREHLLKRDRALVRLRRRGRHSKRHFVLRHGRRS